MTLPVLQLRGLTKRFAGQIALDDVSMSLEAGEVHGLIGENGSGKSTLIKCLAGYYRPDGGEILVDGDVVTPDPVTASELGLRFVHQDPAIFPSLTVAENLAIGSRFEASGYRVRWRSERREAREALVRVDVTVDLDAPMSSLSAAQRTMVAIARELRSRTGASTRLLVLDEPTAALPEHEAHLVFDVVRGVAAHGVAVIYVSHRLEELFELASRVTILRDGKRVAVRDTAELDPAGLVRLIVGAELRSALVQSAGAPPSDRERLRVEGVVSPKLDGVSLGVAEGEVLGVAGLLGSGRSELARVLFGAQQPDAGEVYVDGQRVQLRNPRAAMDAGIALVPENRRDQSVFSALSMADNVSMCDLTAFTRMGTISARRERRDAVALAERFDVRPRATEKPFGLFSGGNQQKAILARWLRLRPRIVILDEPTQGIDVHAKTVVFDVIRELSAAGVSVVLISSEFSELEHLCHRVIVLRRRRISAELVGASIRSELMTQHAFLDPSSEGEGVGT